MTKEWTGGAPMDKQLEASRELLKRNSNVLAKTFTKHFKMPVKAEDFLMVDYNKGVVISEPETAKFYINLISKSQSEIQFYRSIYSSKKQFDFVFPEERTIFNQYFEKLSLILSTFYVSVEVIYMGQASISRSLDSFLNKVVSPNLSIFQDNIKILGIEPRFKHLSKPLEKDERTDVVNLFEGHEMAFISKFIKNINEHAVPEDSDIVISLDDDIEDLRRNLSLIGMCLV